MGDGYIYKCEKCGTEYHVFTGAGMAYPRVYKETVKAIKNGDHGEELKEIFLARNDVAVDAENHLYYCEKCGKWEVTEDMSVYYRKDGAKTDFAFMVDTDKEYALLKKAEHKCPDCGSEMTRDPDIEELACPNCGTKNRPSVEVMWD